MLSRRVLLSPSVRLYVSDLNRRQYAQEARSRSGEEVAFYAMWVSGTHDGGVALAKKKTQAPVWPLIVTLSFQTVGRADQVQDGWLPGHEFKRKQKTVRQLMTHEQYA